MTTDRRVRLGDADLVVAAGRHDAFWDLAEAGTWEPETFSILRAVLTPGSRMVDVGTWIGPVTLVAASLGASVLGYEPDPVARAEAEENVRRSGLSGRVEIVGAALGVEAGEARLASDALGDSMSSLVRDRATEGAVVEVRRVDDEARARRFPEAALVKVDVEGSEYAIVPPLVAALVSGGFRGALLLSTHVYPTTERVLRGLPGFVRDHRIPRGIARRVVAHGVTPLLLARDAARLARSLVVFPHRYVAERNQGHVRALRPHDLAKALLRPREREYLLSMHEVHLRPHGRS